MRKISKVIMLVLLVISLGACSGRKGLRIVKHYLTTDWDTKRYIIEGRIENDSNSEHENVVISYELIMKNDKSYDVGEVTIPKLKTNNDQREYKLDIHDKVKDIKDFNILAVKTVKGHIK